jgi:hypothetical protein
MTNPNLAPMAKFGKHLETRVDTPNLEHIKRVILGRRAGSHGILGLRGDASEGGVGTAERRTLPVRHPLARDAVAAAVRLEPRRVRARARSEEHNHVPRPASGTLLGASRRL